MPASESESESEFVGEHTTPHRSAWKSPAQEPLHVPPSSTVPADWILAVHCVTLLVLLYHWVI